MAPARKSTSRKRSRDSDLVLLERISASLDTYMAGLPAAANDDPPPPLPFAADASPSPSPLSPLQRRSTRTTSVGGTMTTRLANIDRGAEEDEDEEIDDDGDDSVDDDDNDPGGGGGESFPSAITTNDDSPPSSSSSMDDAAKDLLATRALVRSIVKACAHEGIGGIGTKNGGGVGLTTTDDEGNDESSMIVDALVSEYSGRYPSLVGDMILDGMARRLGSRGGIDDDDDVVAVAASTAPSPPNDDDIEGLRGSKFARIVTAVESDMRTYEEKIEAIRTARSIVAATTTEASTSGVVGGGDVPSLPKSKRGRPSGVKTTTTKKKEEEGRLFDEIARRYVGARDALHRLPNGHLKAIVDEARRELGLEHVEIVLNKIDKRLRRIYSKHRNREGAPNQYKMILDDIYARYDRMKMVVNGGRLRPGTLNSIIEGVWLEHGVPPDPTKVRAIRQMVQVRFLKEHPGFEPANPNRLKIGQLSEEDKRRRQVLLNEIMARYVSTKAAHGKKGKMTDGTIPKIIEDCKNDLGIHDFDVPPSSIRGRVHRKSLLVQKLGKDSRRYDDAIDAPLVATINGWSSEGISVTRDQGLDLANRILRGKKMDKDDGGNNVVLDAQWWTRFCNRNKKKLVCEIGKS